MCDPKVTTKEVELLLWLPADPPETKTLFDHLLTFSKVHGLEKELINIIRIGLICPGLCHLLYPTMRIDRSKIFYLLTFKCQTSFLSHVIIELDLLLFAELEMSLTIVNLFFLSQQEGL